VPCIKITFITLLQVKTQLENPTRYFIAQKQKRQLKEYLKTQGSPSAAGDLAVSSAIQPTLNAINQQAVAALSSGQLVGQSGSPMAVMSPDGNHPTDVSSRKGPLYYFLQGVIRCVKDLFMRCPL